MKKKIIYAILIIIIAVGAIIIGTKGLNADIVYSKNVRVDVYVGKKIDKNEVEQIAKEVFETDRVLVQQIEYFGDMCSIIMKQEAAENIDEKLETLNTKLNEKYGVENEVDDILVTYQPKIKLSSILKPYIAPIAISIVIILIYALIRFRKVGAIRALFTYILAILVSEALLLSVFAISGIEINRLIMPIGLLVYVFAITITTVVKEKQLSKFKVSQK